MFGLTARKPLLGGKVFQPQKPAPKPAGSSQASASSQPKPSQSETETETERLPEEQSQSQSQSQSVLNEATQPLRIIPIAQQSSGPDDKQTGPTRLIVIPSAKPVAVGATKVRSTISAPSTASTASAASTTANAAPAAISTAPATSAASTSSTSSSKAESEENKPTQNKVLSFPLSVKKKSSLAASSSGEKGPEIDVDKIIESALVLQQMSSHKPSAANKPENKFEDKVDSETDPSYSDDDMEDTLAAHFGTGKSKRIATRKAKTQSAVAAAAAAAPKRAPGRKKYTTAAKERKSKENEEDEDDDEDEDKEKAKAKPRQKRKTKDSATSAESSSSSSAPSSSSSSDPAPKRKKSAASKESSEEKTKKTPKAKASKLLSLFPSSFGEPKRVQRVTCYVRIDQHGVDGLTFVNEDERPVVAEISPSFPNTAGVRLRDVIVSVNNLDGRRTKYDQLMDALICKVPPKPKDPMAELSGVIPKNAVYDTMACIVFARPIPEAAIQID